MTNKYFVSNEHRAARVNDLFNTIAPRYDLINDLQSFGLHRLWKRRLTKLASSQRGERALDLCCGTGDITFALARPGVEVFGLDFSEPMLAVARQKLEGWRLIQNAVESQSSVSFLRGDALNIPFPDASFDIVTISYGLRNLADWKTGLKEMCRVARPGGRLFVLDFGKPESPLLRRLYFFYLKCFVPLMGRVFCGDADTHAYILESLRHYAAQKGVAAEMKELSLTGVQIVNLAGGIMSINCGAKEF